MGALGTPCFPAPSSGPMPLVELPAPLKPRAPPLPAVPDFGRQMIFQNNQGPQLNWNLQQCRQPSFRRKPLNTRRHVTWWTGAATNCPELLAQASVLKFKQLEVQSALQSTSATSGQSSLVHDHSYETVSEDLTLEACHDDRCKSSARCLAQSNYYVRKAFRGQAHLPRDQGSQTADSRTRWLPEMGQ